MHLNWARLNTKCLLNRAVPFLSNSYPQNLIRVLLVAVCLVCPLFVVYSQDDVIKVRTDLVLVPVRVRDKAGKHVGNLTREDFRLSIDGADVSPDFFSTGSPSVNLLFLLDQSGSVRETIAQQRDAARQLFKRFGPESSVAVVRFEEEAHLVYGFSESDSALESAFVFPAEANRHTAIFDSVAKSVRLFEQAPRRPETRNLVILISDGLDTASGSRSREAIKLAQDMGVTIYALQIASFIPDGNRLRARPPAKGFKDLGEKTGGAFFQFGDSRTALAPSSSLDMSRVFDAIEKDLSNQYLLGFYPMGHLRDNQEHTINVSLRSRKANWQITTGRSSFKIF